jgi:hypothetical protein
MAVYYKVNLSHGANHVEKHTDSMLITHLLSIVGIVVLRI